jgi:hypothetical protein
MSFKANIHADQLAQNIKNRTGLAVVKTFDTDGLPVLSVGTIGAGSNGCLIKLLEEKSIQKNSIGQSQEVFTPHRLAMVVEDVSGAGAKPMTDASKFLVTGELCMQGMAVDIYVRANGSAPVVADIVAGNLKASFAPDIYFPLTNQQ